MVSIDNPNGSIRISNEVFSNLAGDAAMNCFGVKGMAGKNKGCACCSGGHFC